MLLALQEQATRYHVSVVSLQPGSTVTERRLTATQLTLRMRGRFVDVIAFVQHISTASAVISVSRTDLAVSSQADTMRDPQLDATVHATLYRLQSVDLMGDSTVASSR
jgi:Tfp pilus assembly protein PilO